MMEVTADLLAFARGYADGVNGTESLPYNQFDQKELVRVYRLGHAHGTYDHTPSALPVPEPYFGAVGDVLPSEPAAPIRAKTGK